MYAGRDFSPQEFSESEVFGFDFINDLDPGEELLSSVWTLRVAAGSDPQVLKHLQGPPLVVVPFGGTLKTGTIQRIGGLKPGVTYAAHALVITTLGNSRNLWAHIRGITHELQ